MLIISVRDHENNRWKGNEDRNKTKKKQRQKAARGADAIVEASELNDFVVHLR